MKERESKHTLTPSYILSGGQDPPTPWDLRPRRNTVQNATKSIEVYTVMFYRGHSQKSVTKQQKVAEKQYKAGVPTSASNKDSPTCV